MFESLAVLQQHDLSEQRKFFIRGQHVGFVTATRFELLRQELPHLFQASCNDHLLLHADHEVDAARIAAALETGYQLVRQQENNFIDSPAERIAVSLALDPARPDSSRSKSNNAFSLPYYGAHLNIYTRTDKGIKIWLSKRSHKVFTYQGCWEMAVACIIPYGDSPHSAIRREAYEEAGLTENYLGHLQFVKRVDQTFDRIYRHGLHLDRQYYFDLELPPHSTLTPIDEEAEAFVCVTPDEAVAMMQQESDWKHNGAATVLDFCLRHRLYQPDAQTQDFIAQCLHQPLPLDGVAAQP